MSAAEGTNLFYIWNRLSVATTATVIAVAEAEKDNEDKDDYPYIAVIKNIAEAAHNYFRPFSFLKVAQNVFSSGAFAFLIL